MIAAEQRGSVKNVWARSETGFPGSTGKNITTGGTGMKERYAKIIGRSYSGAPRRPYMSMQDRAAQFSPFAALTGFDDAVEETARLTDPRLEQDEAELEMLDLKLEKLIASLPQHPQVRITWFKADEKKSGGAYITTKGVVKKINTLEGFLQLEDGQRIALSDIAGLGGSIFSGL